MNNNNKSNKIRELLLLGKTRQEIYSFFPEETDYESLGNLIGVLTWELRQQHKLPPRPKSSKPSRHQIIKKGLIQDKSNSQILKQLVKYYPQISERVHKQRICEYRWFYKQGLL